MGEVDEARVILNAEDCRKQSGVYPYQLTDASRVMDSSIVSWTNNRHLLSLCFFSRRRAIIMLTIKVRGGNWEARMSC